MEMKGILFPRFVWIVGQWIMIAQGTDGLLQGDLTCGVMNDGSFLTHIPLLNLSALKYAGTLKAELVSWLPDKRGGWSTLDEEDWFDIMFDNQRATTSGPLRRPRLLACVAIEQLCEVKHIHPKTNHVFVVPALMTSGWRKLLGRQSDVLLTLPVGPLCWPPESFEPLVLSLTCAMFSHSP